MAMTYNWTIAQLERQTDTGGVIVSHWNVTTQDGDYTADTAAQADIAAQKQALRDVTADARIEAASTPEELKTLTLDVLLN